MDMAFAHKALLSVMTRIELLSWTTGQRLLDEDIQQFITESEVLELTESIILQTVRLRRHYKKVKLTDAIIAATAMVNNFTLLSTNDSDFEKITGLTYKSLNA